MHQIDKSGEGGWLSRAVFLLLPQRGCVCTTTPSSSRARSGRKVAAKSAAVRMLRMDSTSALTGNSTLNQSYSSKSMPLIQHISLRNQQWEHTIDSTHQLHCTISSESTPLIQHINFIAQPAVRAHHWFNTSTLLHNQQWEHTIDSTHQLSFITQSASRTHHWLKISCVVVKSALS